MRRELLVCLSVLAALITGCGKHDEAANNAGAQNPAPPAVQTTTPPAAPNTPEAKARALLEQLQKQSYEHRWNEAAATLQQLEALRPSLKEDLRDEIDNARGSLNAAKEIAKQSGER